MMPVLPILRCPPVQQIDAESTAAGQPCLQLDFITAIAAAVRKGGMGLIAPRM